MKYCDTKQTIVVDIERIYIFTYIYNKMNSKEQKHLFD